MALIKKISALFIFLIITYVFLLTFSYSIPNKKITANSVSGLQYLNKYKDYPYFFGNRYYSLDYITDRTMLSLAQKNDTDSVLKAASVPSYSRYWHGYQVFLRPLLFYFDYDTIKLFLSNFLLFLFFAVLHNLWLKSRNLCAFFAFCTTIFGIQLSAICLQYIGVFIISLSFTLAIALYPKPNQSKLLLFFACGSLTSFIDFLTFPLLTFGMPALIFISYNYKDDLILKLTILYASMWFLGYSATWGTKWILASLILGPSEFLVTLKSILLRLSVQHTIEQGTVHTSILDSLKTNFAFFNPRLLRENSSHIYMVFLFSAVLFYINSILYAKFVKLKTLLALAFIALLPIIWFIILKNHSYIHHFMTFRILFLSVFSFFVYVYILKDSGQYRNATRATNI